MALAIACAPHAPSNVLATYASIESGFNPLAVHDNTSGRSYALANGEEAIALARELLRGGHSIDAGIMQINSTNFEWTGLSVEAAFDPCASIKAAADILVGASRYNTGTPSRGFTNGYVKKYIGAARALKAASVNGGKRADFESANPGSAPGAASIPPTAAASPQQPTQTSSFVITASSRSSSFVIMGQR